MKMFTADKEKDSLIWAYTDQKNNLLTYYTCYFGMKNN